MILPIYTYNHLILRTPTINVSADNPHIKSLIIDMYETLRNANGVGLAAPQVGSNIRLMIVEFEIFEGASFKGTFINPKILDKFGPIYEMNESCLSLPGIGAKIERHGSILLEYYDENWKKHNEFFHEIQSRILQHEIDHLEGKLYIDRINVEDKLKLAISLSKIDQGEFTCGYKTFIRK
jgi:peptide deformylase